MTFAHLPFWFIIRFSDLHWVDHLPENVTELNLPFSTHLLQLSLSSHYHLFFLFVSSRCTTGKGVVLKKRDISVVVWNCCWAQPALRSVRTRCHTIHRRADLYWVHGYSSCAGAELRLWTYPFDWKRAFAWSVPGWLRFSRRWGWSLSHISDPDSDGES